MEASSALLERDNEILRAVSPDCNSFLLRGRMHVRFMVDFPSCGLDERIWEPC
jgi:hypothetical protein